jgi:hypothetical protein
MSLLFAVGLIMEILETKSPEAGNWAWPSAMIIAPSAASFDGLAAGRAQRYHAGCFACQAG